MQERSLSVSGIHRVKALLDEISRNNIKGIKYFELAACNYGCVGGVFNVVNPFQARFNLRRLQVRGHRPVKQDYSQYNYELPGKFEALRIGQLDSDLEKAMAKFMQLEKEIESCQAWTVLPVVLRIARHWPRISLMAWPVEVIASSC